MGQNAGSDHSGIGYARQQQRVGPQQDTRRHSGDGAARGAASPGQAAEQRRRQLRDRGKRQQADRGKLLVARGAIIRESEKQNDEDRDPADGQQPGAGVARLAAECAAALDQKRQHDVVRHHDRERHRFDDHHGGCRREAADESDQRHEPGMGGQRQRQHEHVAVDAAWRKIQQTSHRDRQHEYVDQHEIDREQPGGAADFGLAVVFDHGDVELPRQQHDREQGERCHRAEHGKPRSAGQHRRRPRFAECAGEQRKRTGKHHEGDKDADGEECHELDDRFGGDRQHQPVLMFGGVGVARAEQHRKRRHEQRDEQRAVAEHRRQPAARSRRGHDRADRRGHRLELQRDVRNHADDGDQRHRRCHGRALAVARRNQIGDRGDILTLGEPYDAQQQRIAKPDHDHRADIDGEEIVAGARGEPDRAEERPRGAVDRQRKRIDPEPRGGTASPARAVAVARYQKQKPDIAERNEDDDPSLQHDTPPRSLCGALFRLIWPRSPQFVGSVYRPGPASRALNSG